VEKREESLQQNGGDGTIERALQAKAGRCRAHYSSNHGTIESGEKVACDLQGYRKRRAARQKEAARRGAAGFDLSFQSGRRCERASGGEEKGKIMNLRIAST